MTTNKAIESSAARDLTNDNWQQVTPGERFKIRVSSAQTMGAYSVMEVVADPRNGVPLHIHNREEEHFIVLDGTLDIAIGNRRWDAAVGSCVTAKRGEPHAWCNPSATPLRMLVVFSPGHIEGLFKAAAGVDDVDKIAAIAARYGTADRTAAPREGSFDLLAAEIQRPLSRIGFTWIYENGDLAGDLVCKRRVLRKARWRSAPRQWKENTAMEMHSRQSLYEIHGITTERRRRRSRLIARLLIARIVAFLTKVKRAIETELAIRRAMTELAEMDDHMLRDLGIHRSEIESRLRRRRADVGTDDVSVFSNIAAQNHLDLPTINSPLIVSEGWPEQQSRKVTTRPHIQRQVR